MTCCQRLNGLERGSEASSPVGEIILGVTELEKMPREHVVVSYPPRPTNSQSSPTGQVVHNPSDCDCLGAKLARWSLGDDWIADRSDSRHVDECLED